MAGKEQLEKDKAEAAAQEVQGDAMRMTRDQRDALGRAISTLTERVAALEGLLGGDEDMDEQSQPPPQPQSIPSPMMPGVPQGERILYDPQTNQYFRVPQSLFAPGVPQSPMLFPQQQQQQQPLQNRQSQAPQRTSQMDTLESMYNEVADDLQYFAKLHPRHAEELAAKIVKQVSKTGDSLQEVMGQMARSNPSVAAVLRERLSQNAALVGARVSFEEAAAAEGAGAKAGEDSQKEKPSKTGKSASGYEERSEAGSEETDGAVGATASQIKPTRVGAGAAKLPSTPPRATSKSNPEDSVNAVIQKLDATFG